MLAGKASPSAHHSGKPPKKLGNLVGKASPSAHRSGKPQKNNGDIVGYGCVAMAIVRKGADRPNIISANPSNVKDCGPSDKALSGSG